MGVCGDAGYFVLPETAAFLAEGIVVSPGFRVWKTGCEFQLLHLLAVWASFLTILNLYFTPLWNNSSGFISAFVSIKSDYHGKHLA